MSGCGVGGSGSRIFRVYSDDPFQLCILRFEERLTHFEGDVRDLTVLQQAMDDFEPEIIFHLAAQSLVRRSYPEPTFTFETNAVGSLNALECIRQRPQMRVGVIITSDKCYHNKEWVWGYRENDLLGGNDPYSASKACAEIIFAAYARSYFHNAEDSWVATTRAGNVIGGGDSGAGPHRPRLHPGLVSEASQPGSLSSCYAALAACSGAFERILMAGCQIVARGRTGEGGILQLRTWGQSQPIGARIGLSYGWPLAGEPL